MSSNKWRMVGMAIVSAVAFAAGIAVTYIFESISAIKTWRAECAVAVKMSDLLHALESPNEAYEFGWTLRVKISALPDLEKRVAWYRKAVAAVSELESDNIDLYNRLQTMNAIDEFLRPINGAWFKDGKSAEDIWFTICDKYALRVRQIQRLKKEYDELGLQIHDVSSSRVSISRIKERMRKLNSVIENGTAHIETTIGYFESSFWQDDYKMTPESRTSAMNRFEQSLGRPIRTLKQIEADRQKRTESYLHAETVERRQREKDRESNAKMDINAL